MSVYKIPQADALRLGLDAYRVHQLLCMLFVDISTPAGRLLWADKGYICCHRVIVLQSPMKPARPQIGEMSCFELPADYLEKSAYSFEVVINSTIRDSKTNRRKAIRNPAEILAWFTGKTPAWGFDLTDARLMDVNTDISRKGDTRITLAKARIIGRLQVSDRDLFRTSFRQGIGHARGLGCGLLQLDPEVKL